MCPMQERGEFMRPNPEQPADSIYASLTSKLNGKIPTILFVFVNITTFVCTKADLSTWKIHNWIIFLPPYILLFICSILWIVEALRDKRNKRRRSNYVLRKQEERKDTNSKLRGEIFSQLIDNSRTSEIELKESELFGKDFHVTFNNSEKKENSSRSKIRRMR